MSIFSRGSLFGSVLARTKPLPLRSLVGPTVFTRFKCNLTPKHVKHERRFKGRVPIPIGGSIKGTTLKFGEWGIRVRGNGVRLTQKQLQTAEEVIRRKLKVIKGVKLWMRVFTDIPVCVKGNETRMGKGKGFFEYWACRAPIGRVLLEIGGPPIRRELAQDALRQAGAKLPCSVEFIDRNTPPRLGNLVLHPPRLTAASPAIAKLALPPPSASVQVLTA